jgi:hypothetical protein
MPRTATFWANENAPAGSQPLLLCAEMWGGGLPETLSIVCDTEDLSIGNTLYTALPFSFDFKASAGEPAQVTWEVPNISRQIGAYVEDITGQPRVRFFNAYRSDPTQTVWEQWMLRAASWRITSETVSLEIATIDAGTEPVHGGTRAVESILPGMRFVTEAA